LTIYAKLKVIGSYSPFLQFYLISTTKLVKNRADVVKNLLRLEYLNESGYVQRLIVKHNDIFHIPGNKLGYNAIKHTIKTNDAQPVHTKQYRFPPMHKEEVNKQTKELLETTL